MKKVFTEVTIGGIFSIVIIIASWLLGFRSGSDYQRKITQDVTDKYNSLNAAYSRLNNTCAGYYSMFQDVAALGLDYKQQTNYYLSEIKYIVAGDMKHADAMAGGISQINIEIDNILSKYSDATNKN